MDRQHLTHRLRRPVPCARAVSCAGAALVAAVTAAAARTGPVAIPTRVGSPLPANDFADLIPPIPTPICRERMEPDISRGTYGALTIPPLAEPLDVAGSPRAHRALPTRRGFR